MTPTAETVHVATRVPKDLVDDLRDLARASERSTAAEIRLAIKAWVEDHRTGPSA